MSQTDFRDLNRELARVEQVVKPVYLVGGCVRDALMGKKPHDYDFASPLEPDDIEKAVRAYGRKPYLAGKRFGTIGFKLDGNVIEVTTFRTESYPNPGRHPEVHFETDIEKDLSRRDFSINAMAYKDKLYDPFNGQKDLKEKRIRSVGDPFERINEDPLRMLRAARFASQLGFVVDDEYIEAAQTLRGRLYDVSKERWTMELDKLLCGGFSAEGIYTLMKMELLSTIFPEAVILEADPDIHAIRIARALGKTEALPSTRWAVLFAHLSEGCFGSAGPKDRSEQQLFAQELVKKYGPYLHFSKAKAFEILAILNETWSFYIA